MSFLPPRGPAASTTTTTESDDVPGASTSTDPTSPDGAPTETTTSTRLGTGATTTTVSEEKALASPDQPPPSGRRGSAGGLQVGYQSELFGSFADDGLEVLGVELSIEFRKAVELIKPSWVWVLALAALVATLIVTGLDHRRSLEEHVRSRGIR